MHHSLSTPHYLGWEGSHEALTSCPRRRPQTPSSCAWKQPSSTSPRSPEPPLSSSLQAERMRACMPWHRWSTCSPADGTCPCRSSTRRSIHNCQPPSGCLPFTMRHQASMHGSGQRLIGAHTFGRDIVFQIKIFLLCFLPLCCTVLYGRNTGTTLSLPCRCR